MVPLDVVRERLTQYIQCVCGPEYTERNLIAPDCSYHDAMDALDDLDAVDRSSMLFTIEEYLAIVEPAGDGAKLELIRGRMWYGGEPFDDLVARYLAVVGQKSDGSSS